MLSGLHIGHHYGDETIIRKHGKVTGNEFVVGLCNYKAVVMPSMVSIDESTVDLLGQFIQNGGKVISIGDFPTFSTNSERLKWLGENVVHMDMCRDKLYGHLVDMQIPGISISDGNGEISSIHYMERDLGNEKIYFMVNHDQEGPSMPPSRYPMRGRLRKIIAETGEIIDLDFVSEDGYTKTQLQFLPMQSHILILDGAEVRKRKAPGSWRSKG